MKAFLLLQFVFVRAPVVSYVAFVLSLIVHHLSFVLMPWEGCVSWLRHSLCIVSYIFYISLKPTDKVHAKSSFIISEKARRKNVVCYIL